ncbi:MAG: GNAT family N-acetyltransferase [Ruminococcus sp.]|nr:GNAT family N-acetyltransferase [Ruminococcus sp.]
MRYEYTHDFTEQQLEKLFLSVEWESGKYPEKLVKAMQGYSTVISAWENDELKGLICAMDDGVMTAYVHYLLVDPACQGKGVGAELVRLLKEHYKDYLKILILVYKDKLGFYEKCGFKCDDFCLPMSISEL